MSKEKHTSREGEEPVDPGFGIAEPPTGENLPPEGILRRYIVEPPPAPPMDAPIPPQDIKPEGEGEATKGKGKEKGGA
jgi:hypothetical protein